MQSVAERRRAVAFLAALTLAVGYQQTISHPVTEWNEKAYERFLWDAIKGLILLRGSAGITRVQGNARGVSTTGAPSLGVTMAQTPTNGNLLIAVIGVRSTTSVTVSSITQTGVTWTGGINGKQVGLTDAALDVEIWLGTVGSGASTSVTINYSAANIFNIADICEYSGLSSSPLDKTATSTTGNSSPPTDTGTTATTTQAAELWVGTTMAYNQSAIDTTQSNPTNGFTLLDGANSSGTSNKRGSLSFLEKIVSSTGTANSGTTINSSTWDGCIATFKGAATPNPIPVVTTQSVKIYQCQALDYSQSFLPQLLGSLVVAALMTLRYQHRVSG